MADINLNDLNLENIGSWPNPVKIATTIILCAIIIGLGYWFDTKEQLLRLDSAEQQEVKLRAEFEAKQQKAANLDAYRQQLAQMRLEFGAMLKQLPGKTEVPGLLEDISKTGVRSGLHFRLFDPLQEVQHDFYAELPIKIAVVGNYHQLANFVSRVAALSRIVTLHDIDIQAENNQQQGNQSGVQQLNHEKLRMDITANIYRYKEEDDGGTVE